MTCRDYKDLMMAYLDNELDDAEKKTLEDHLAHCRQCADELNEFKSLKTMTDDIILVEPEDQIWQHYWDNVYNRIERGLGWILFSLAGICLVLYGGFKFIEEIASNPGVSFFLKVTLLGLILGLGILLVSVLRERLYFWKRDRYRDVRR